MSSLNKVQIIGNMTRDAEVKETPNGNKVANFSVATSRFWKDAGGEKQEETEFHNITAWGKLAEIVESYTEKGKKVYIEGYLKTRSWEGEDEKKRYKTEIVAESIILLSNKNRDNSEDTEEEFPEEVKPEPKKQPVKKAKPDEKEITIEDLPF